MLFWQRKSTHKRLVLWAKLAAISAGAHLLVLGWFFFIFKDRSSRLSLVITPDLFDNMIEYRIAPLPKSKAIAVPKRAPKPAAKRAPVLAKKKQTTIQKKVSPAKKAAPIKKAVPAKKTAAQPKPKPIAKKAAVKKAVPKASVAKPQPKPDKVPAQETHHEFAINKLGVHEKGLLEEFKALHEDIVAKWAPPPGVSPDCSCQVTMLIDWKGQIKKLSMQESSGVLMFDTAAQKVLTYVDMPKWTWGKEITITFNQ